MTTTRPSRPLSGSPAPPADSGAPAATTAEAYDRAVATLAGELRAGRPPVVLTGAGLSTDSGIPDYRGPGSPVRRPMTYDEFVSGPQARQRYWARAHLGWRRLHGAAPNAGHRALAALDPALLVTQNVDGLHEQAGTRRVVALHGRIADVVCLDCGQQATREAYARRLEEANPGFAEEHADVLSRPDGDTALEDTSRFVVPGCAGCGGRVKPDVVFFGENVPAARVARCSAAVDRLAATGGSLLVVGSSLQVMSGLRFVKRAVRNGTRVVVVNRGPTRGDPLADQRVEAGCSAFLTDLIRAGRGTPS